jgi:hypothetical protein
MPCVCCFVAYYRDGIHTHELSEEQKRTQRVTHGATEAAYVGKRGLSQKCPDREAIPLCKWHHTEGPESPHRLGKRFWSVWGIDRDELVRQLQERYEKEKVNADNR